MLEKTLKSHDGTTDIKASVGEFHISLFQANVIEGRPEDFILMDKDQLSELGSIVGTKTTRKPTPKGAQAYKGNGKHKWEEVTSADAGHTYRLRVPGGWLYRTVSMVAEDINEVQAQSTVFVPVPDAVGYAV